MLEDPDDEVLIGSLAPIPFAPGAWAARAATAEPYLGPRRTKDLVAALGQLRPAGPAPAATPNRDLFPRDEYAAE